MEKCGAKFALCPLMKDLMICPSSPKGKVNYAKVLVYF
jgi:hypothetical protein